MSAWIDISVPVQSYLPHWPGSPPPRVVSLKRMADGCESNVTWLEGEAHMGTHVDAPRHFFDTGATVDEMPLELWMGPAWVADFSSQHHITASVLQSAEIPSGTERLLLKTHNSTFWMMHDGFRKDYTGLTADAARWVVDRGIRLVGIDYLSIARFEEVVDVHRTLLGAGVAVVEGLNLLPVAAGAYHLVCLPLRLAGAEAAPARALLRKEGAV